MKKSIFSFFSDISKTLAADKYFRKGNELYDSGNYEEAIKFYDKAMEIKPDVYEALGNKGMALYYLDKFNESQVYLNMAEEIKKQWK